MSWLGYLTRRKRDDDLAREIDQYVAQETDDNIARGMTREDARAAALRKFGNRTIVRETVYRRNTVNWLDVLLQDLKYGLRQLRLRPGFALAAIVSLALGIAANTAIFTLVDQLVLRLLPVERPHELVKLRVDGPRPGGNWGDSRYTLPYPTYVALRDRQTVFTGVTGQRIEPISLLDDNGGNTVPVAMVAGNYFQVFGVRPHLGRLLQPDDDRDVGGHPVAVLQYDFWQSQYQGRPGIVGESIRLNGHPFSIVGVAAPGFEGTNVGTPMRVFVPITMQATIAPQNPRLDDERSAWYVLFARLKTGVSMSQAEAAMKTVYRQRQEEELAQAYFSKFPEAREGFLRQVFSLEPADRGNSALRGRFEQPLLVLEALAAAVLLIACANIAGLLLARGAASQRSLAIRRAMGASRGRIVGQLFAESAVLAVTGAAAGLVLGMWLTQLLIALLPDDAANLSLSATPDLRVVLFTTAVTAVTALLFGLFPAWQNSQVAPASTLRDESGSIAGGRRHLRLRKIFVGVQVALSAVLLLGAGLFARSLVNLSQVNLGFAPENVVTFVARPVALIENARKPQVYRTLIEGLAQVPGIVAVGANRNPLLSGRADGAFTIAGDIPRTEQPFTFQNGVSPGYFEALGIPVKAGQALTWNDWGTGRRVAFVNETLTKTYFDGAAPLTRRIGIGTRAETNIEIVGVVGDARYHDIRGDIPGQTFFNLDSLLDGISRVNVYAKVSGNPHEMMPRLRAAVSRIDSNMVVSGMRTLDQQIDFQMSNERMLSMLSTGFAALATLLAILGVHGVLAFQVARRTREMGVRMALGAGRGVIVRLVANELAGVILVGLAVGVAAGYFGGRLVQSQLFGLDARDPVIFGVTIGALVSAAAVATLIPALRASRIDPVGALRHE